MPSGLITTLQSFLSHNAPLVIFGGMSFIFLILALLKPKKFFILMFVGFFILAFNFEYNKHLFPKIETDMLDLFFPPQERFRKYDYIKYFFKSTLPVVFNVAGWGLIGYSIVWKSRGSDK